MVIPFELLCAEVITMILMHMSLSSLRSKMLRMSKCFGELVMPAIEDVMKRMRLCDPKLPFAPSYPRSFHFETVLDHRDIPRSDNTLFMDFATNQIKRHVELVWTWDENGPKWHVKQTTESHPVQHPKIPQSYLHALTSKLFTARRRYPGRSDIEALRAWINEFEVPYVEACNTIAENSNLANNYKSAFDLEDGSDFTNGPKRNSHYYKSDMSAKVCRGSFVGLEKLIGKVVHAHQNVKVTQLACVDTLKQRGDPRPTLALRLSGLKSCNETLKKGDVFNPEDLYFQLMISRREAEDFNKSYKKDLLDFGKVTDEKICDLYPSSLEDFVWVPLAQNQKALQAMKNLMGLLKSA